MERLFKAVKVASIIMLITIVIITVMAYFSVKKEIQFVNREKAMLDYYESVETLLDSLCIYENDSIFNTNVGNKYLESKYKFDSLIINNRIK